MNKSAARHQPPATVSFAFQISPLINITPTGNCPAAQVSQADLQALAAEAMGWQSLEQGAYLHHGATQGEENVIHVVGLPDASMAGMNVLLVGW